jgi:hypothetical protein
VLAELDAGENVRVDVSQREVLPGEPDLSAELVLQLLDLPVRMPRVRAFMIAGLDDQVRRPRATDVIDGVIQVADITGQREPAVRRTVSLELSAEARDESICICLHKQVAVDYLRSQAAPEQTPGPPPRHGEAQWAKEPLDACSIKLRSSRGQDRQDRSAERD